MFRFAGRFIAALAGLVLIQMSDSAPWWGSILAIVVGLMLIEGAHRDYLKAAGRLS